MLDQKFYMSVHLMAALAYQGCERGKLSSSEELAKTVRTNPTVVRRLVSRLVAAGLLKAYKGKKGGVELARCPNEITLEDIYVASCEQPLLRTPKRATRKQCAVSCAMGGLMSAIFGGVERKSREYLRGIKLSELREQIPA